MTGIRLGLIGDNIRASRAPALHRLAGTLCGLDVRYDLLIPAETGLEFDALFDRCRAEGLAGLNITLPYKERAVQRVTIDDPLAARIGAINTVRFGDDGPRGFNTDHSGFVAAFRDRLGSLEPGRVALFGAGGVGKAVAFGLVALGAREIRFIDPDTDKATALARAVTAAGGGHTRGVVTGIDGLAGADGVINCTPLGMVGYGGSPVPQGRFPAAGWAFDAVYTPTDTLFREQAETAGARFLSGYELFFWQGVHAFEIFTGTQPGDLNALRAALAGERTAADA